MAGEVERLQELVDKYDNIVFFGGAGVSTESGIPDFRSQDGLYHQKYDYPPETILSHTFFMRKPEEFFKFYRDKMLCDTAKPNAAHLKLAELEQAVKDFVDAEESVKTGRLEDKLSVELLIIKYSSKVK